MTVDSYCPYCDLPFTASTEPMEDSMRVRGADVSYTASVIRCPTCGQIVADSRVERHNIDAAYDAYRQVTGIVSADEIARLRKEYGLSVREFGRFLGFGEQTIQKYESGTLPDTVHSNTIRMAETAEGASMLLSLNRATLRDDSIAKIERFASTRPLIPNGEGRLGEVPRDRSMEESRQRRDHDIQL